METPFDNLMNDLWQSLPKYNQQYSSSNKLFFLVFNFTKIAKVLYLDMWNASAQMLIHIREGDGEQFQPLVDPTRCNLSYFEFIEHINRIGRVFKNEGFILPLYQRIYFFRNKMIEHWDDYLPYFTGGNGLSSFKNKIAVPYFLEGSIGSMNNRSQAQTDIIAAFARYGVTLSSLDRKWYREYCDEVYEALENIDRDLRSPFGPNKSMGVPNDIVDLLFKYSFPTPIHDVEAYCTEFAGWLGNLPY